MNRDDLILAISQWTYVEINLYSDQQIISLLGANESVLDALTMIGNMKAIFKDYSKKEIADKAVFNLSCLEERLQRLNNIEEK